VTTNAALSAAAARASPNITPVATVTFSAINVANAGSKPAVLSQPGDDAARASKPRQIGGAPQACVQRQGGAGATIRRSKSASAIVSLNGFNAGSNTVTFAGGGPVGPTGLDR